ncbi:MAG: hypothetical protein ISS80_04285 [Candidatus Cloacimonetes bacterium]|nr:hypothetical protein [Bacteroidota bacterium]MBL7149272.1 hypothetical protein [Candidatus Cloacimonadota bacterium]
MNQSIPLVWYIAMGAAFGLLLGYAIGMIIGVSQGKQQLIKKIKILVSRKKIDFDIDKLLRG